MTPLAPVVTDPTIPTSLVSVLIIAVVALAGAVVFLFKHYQGRLQVAEDARRKHDEEVANERIAWAAERTKLEFDRKEIEKEIQGEYEKRHRMLLEEHARTVREVYDASREHEISARHEYAQNMELVATKAAEAQDKIGVVLEKFYVRFVGSKQRTRD